MAQRVRSCSLALGFPLALLLFGGAGGAMAVPSTTAPAATVVEPPRPNSVEGFVPGLGSRPVFPPTLENFMVAAQNGDLEAVRAYYAKNPAFATMRTKSGSTALHVAVFAPTPEVAAFLLDHGADVNAATTDTDKRTPLINAVTIGRNLALVQLLVERGADPNRPDGLGNLPLHLAVASRAPSIALFLAEHGARDTTTPVFDALAQNDLARLRVELKNAPALAFQTHDLKRPMDQPRLMLTEELTPLHAAVLWNRPLLVQALFDAKADVKARDAEGQTPLHEAAALDASAIATLLLAAGADVNAPAQNQFGVFLHPREAGETPLHLAAGAGALATATILLEHGAQVDAQTVIAGAGFSREGGKAGKPPLGRTPLQYALSAKSAPLVALLLKYGAKAKGPQGDDAPLLGLLSQGGIAARVYVEPSEVEGPHYRAVSIEPVLEMVRALLKAGANPNARNPASARGRNDDPDTLLTKAVSLGSPELVTLLLDAGADVNALTQSGTSALHLALAPEIAEHPTTLPELLMGRGADVNARDASGQTPLFIGVKNADVERVRELLKRGASAKVTDKVGHTPLLLTQEGQGIPEYERIAALLRDKGAGDATSTFFAAIAGGDEKTVKASLQAQPTLLQARSAGHETPLDHAIRNHREKMVALLLASGADPADCSWGSPALFMATDFGPPSTVKLLLDHGAKVNARNGDGETALFWAVHNSSLEMLTMLLQAGADVKVSDKEKSTALHVCVDEGSLNDADAKVMDALLRAGADVNARDARGETPLHLAAQNGKRAGVTWLLAHGANVNALDTAGYTPLHWAQLKGHIQTAALLKGRGGKV